MAYWDIYLNEVRLTSAMRQFINTIKVKYELSKITTGQIMIESNSYLEGLFTEGQNIRITMGKYRHDQINMIDGKIIKTPDGTANEYLSYTIDIAEKNVKMSYSAKIINYKIQKKDVIIKEVILRNGYIPFVDISDKGVIPVQDNIIQNNETDTVFMTRMAEKWRCAWWVDQDTRTIYFMDYEKVYKKGSETKKISADDLTTEYLLGYRTSGVLNNIADIKWKNKPSQGSTYKADNPNFKYNTDTGLVEFYDITFKPNPETIKLLETDPEAYSKILADIFKQQNNDDELKTIKKYFIQFPAVQSKNNKNYETRRDRVGTELMITLNNEDYFLRPPRQALLKSGTPNPKGKASYLPPYVAGNEPRKYKIDMVETSIAGGFPQTMLRAIPA